MSSSSSSPGGGLLTDLLDALGGEARIAAVTSYARDAVVRCSAPGPGTPPESGPRSLASGSSTLLRSNGGRERTFRAAPGCARVEVWIRSASGLEVLGALAITSPGARHDHAPVEAERDIEGRDEARAQMVSADRIARPACAVCMGETVLREAALEPRNLLAHAAERGAVPRASADGGIEIDLPGQGLVYRFDAGTRLCTRRIDSRRGGSTLYRDWRRVDGIATPFLEIEEEASGTFTRRVLAVAYDLPWPERLFRDPPTPEPPGRH